MTEAEWLTCGDFDLLVTQLDSLAIPRRWAHHFCVACCRRVSHLLQDSRSRDALTLMESLHTDAINWEALRDSVSAASRECGNADLSQSLVCARFNAAHAVYNAVLGLECRVAFDVSCAVAAEKWETHSPRENFEATSAGLERDAEEDRWQVACLKCLVGNPFHPVAFSAEWRTPTALAIAKEMYESRDFSAMPILADALQDAGCDNDDVLNHCRDENAVGEQGAKAPRSPHVRGCWVVDLVLDKS